ncbi:MAG TPA: RNase adapter RapZ [Gammaproteobacteria bacterium]|nr:RNase adapter RapZ [Gammaproteobacteria bacterium]
MRLVIVSGLSGSGKTIVLQALEDLGLYCIDNLPTSLLPAFAEHLQQLSPEHEDAAVGIDARNPSEDFARFDDVLQQLKAQGFQCEILFVGAEESVLLKRFSETRRKHPLSGPDTPLEEAIRTERRLLGPVAASADWRIDTSRNTVHQLRELVHERMAGGHEALSLLFLSFGFKNGIPLGADFVFDVRCLPNPHWEPRLRHLTGRDADVVDYLAQHESVSRMFATIRGVMEEWIPCFEKEHRSYMTVAVGCTGGHHRSVYLVEQLAAHFAERRAHVLARHRELC